MENGVNFFNTFLIQLAGLLNFLLEIYMWMIVSRAIISWVNADPRNPIVHFIYEVTEPVLGRIRRILPISLGGIDFSPMILIMAIMLLKSFLASI
jgi:YggT family protein